MLLFVIVMGILGCLFTIREWWWLYALGIWVYMCIIPVVEASEQTVIQKVVPYRTQGRVFGFAAGVRVGGGADHGVPHRTDRAVLDHPVHELRGRASRRGGGSWATAKRAGSRSMFFFSGLVMVAIALFAFTTRSYRMLTEEYQHAPETAEGEEPSEDAAEASGLRVESADPRR